MTCPDCKGMGYTVEVVNFGLPSAFETCPTCTRCGGTGLINACTVCGNGCPDDECTMCINCQDDLAQGNHD